jgi:hypothetical protein
MALHEDFQMNPITKYLVNRIRSSIEVETIKTLIKSHDSVPFHIAATWNVLPYSYYAYGLFHGCRIAKALGLTAVSAIEFGVAGGNGLVALEAHARTVQRLTGVTVNVYGFDTGEGLTAPRDYRDMPYRFKQGNYKMDITKLKNRLANASLVLGDVEETVPTFIERYAPAPIAFASFDLDYYSSTMAALRLFASDQADAYFLPRIFMYFDDVVGDTTSLYNEFVGELAAIRDFNAQNKYIKIAENRVFRNYNINFNWYHQSYVMHRFHHELYDSYLSKDSGKSLSLK